MRLSVVAAVIALVLVACSSTGTSPSASASVAASAGTSSAPVVPATPSAEPPTSPSAAAFRAGMAVRTISGVALGKEPDAASDPAGTIPAGDTAWIATETTADGATWYQLVPLGPDAAGWRPGWLTSAEGDSPLTPIDLGCDAIGVSASLLAGLSLGDRLACYAEPFTFAARIVGCNCDIDGGFVEPEWLGVSGVTGPDGPVTALLVDEDLTAAPPNTQEWLLLHLDPAATAPDPLPFDTVVEITGQFDHPAAATCVVPEGVEMHPADPVLECRTTLAVTGIKPLE